MLLGLFVFIGGINIVFSANTDDAGVTLNIGNTEPNITSVSTPDALDPNPGTTRTIPTIQVNVTDNDGYADINHLNSYVNITNGETTHVADTCIVDTYSNNWVVLNCSGASFNFYDTPGSWTLTAYVEDTAEASDTETGSDLTYNEGVHLTLNNAPITFGAVYTNTEDNVNTNSPAFNVQNCGNVALNLTITGSNITDGGSNSISASQFRIDDDITPSEGVETSENELTLSEVAQTYIKSGGITTGSSSTWDLYFFVNVPIGQEQATYSVGSWTFTTQKYEE